MLLGQEWKRGLTDVESRGVTLLEDKLVFCFKLAVNVVRGWTLVVCV